MVCLIEIWSVFQRCHVEGEVKKKSKSPVTVSFQHRWLHWASQLSLCRQVYLSCDHLIRAGWIRFVGGYLLLSGLHYVRPHKCSTSWINFFLSWYRFLRSSTRSSTSLVPSSHLTTAHPTSTLRMKKMNVWPSSSRLTSRWGTCSVVLYYPTVDKVQMVHEEFLLECMWCVTKGS